MVQEEEANVTSLLPIRDVQNDLVCQGLAYCEESDRDVAYVL
jgi:hypothetical protein